MSNNTNIKLTLEAWTEIVIKNWLDKIDQLSINNTFDLYNSFVHTIVSNAGGDVARIEFAFLYYGKFIDMGVGRGVTLDEVGISNKRKPKKWYSQIMYSELKKLSEILSEKYAKKGALAIVEGISESKINT